MATELLVIPESQLAEVIKVIRAGLSALDDTSVNVTVVVREQLTRWCKDEEAYLKRLEQPR